MFESLADSYGWTLRYCKWGLTLPQIMRYTRSRNRRFERQRLIQEAQMAESGDGTTTERPRRNKGPVGGDAWMPNPDELPSLDTVVRSLAWMQGSD